jgi:GTP-binding protein
MSAADRGQLPRDEAAEVAFAGRSNAGKSSALNTLCDHRQLARVSKTPGRTQLINLFTLTSTELRGARLVDLPGYGYAAVPGATRESWRKLVGGYIAGRDNLRGVVVVMDSRHPLTDIDEQMLEWAQAHDRRIHVLLTKADKLAFGAQKKVLMEVQRTLGARATVQLFSALKKQGVEEARDAVMRLLGSGTPSI